MERYSPLSSTVSMSWTYGESLGSSWTAPCSSSNWSLGTVLSTVPGCVFAAMVGWSFRVA